MEVDLVRGDARLYVLEIEERDPDDAGVRAKQDRSFFSCSDSGKGSKSPSDGSAAADRAWPCMTPRRGVASAGQRRLQVLG
jgi:hypothetical protein